MADQTALYQWTAIIGTALPLLSTAQVRVLAQWSLGLVLARSCALTAVSLFWATALAQSEPTARQRLREWCYAADDKAGAKRGIKRREVPVTDCFVPLLGWVLSWWEGDQLALALDATTLGERFVVLAVSVVYRGCAIPVGWVILPAGEKHAWKHEWLRLLRHLRPAIPATMTVIVLADRGLYARWLFVRIVRLGWHPFLRVNAGGTFRPDGWHHFARLGDFAPTPDSRWQGTGTAFQGKQSRLRCTLLAWRKAGCKDVWLILTDLPPDAADAGWYGLRAWIEQGFKVTKRGGWQWQRTRMTDPDRAARLWLAVAVATLWLLSVGGAAEVTVPASTLLDVTQALAQGRRQRQATRLRAVSIFRRGLTLIWAALLNRAPLPTGRFVPEPWPTVAQCRAAPTLCPHLTTPLQEAA
ncbi:MAG TPA: transposase [Chloroflexota bacterium]|jgi:hypothetical protein|nr:transposase [Chloroflexota bacterium]